MDGSEAVNDRAMMRGNFPPPAVQTGRLCCTNAERAARHPLTSSPPTCYSHLPQSYAWEEGS
jgi:hypothetical protein